MIAFIKKMFRSHDTQGRSRISDQETLRREVKKGSEEAIKRYRGVLEKLAEYDRV